jgi:hypothetical protein
MLEGGETVDGPVILLGDRAVWGKANSSLGGSSGKANVVYENGTFKTLREIKAGEELLWSYSMITRSQKLPVDKGSWLKR